MSLNSTALFLTGICLSGLGAFDAVGSSARYVRAVDEFPCRTLVDTKDPEGFALTGNSWPAVVVLIVLAKGGAEESRCGNDTGSPSVGSADMMIGPCSMRFGSEWVGGSYSKILSTNTHFSPAVHRAKLRRQARMGRMQIFSERRQL